MAGAARSFSRASEQRDVSLLGDAFIPYTQLGNLAEAVLQLGLGGSTDAVVSRRALASRAGAEAVRDAADQPTTQAWMSKKPAVLRRAGRRGPIMKVEPTLITDTYVEWQDVYRDNVAGIHRLIYTRVGNRSDAEDLTAEVFTATLRPLRLPARVHEVRGYLVATARTVLASFWRRHYAAPPTVIATELLQGSLVQLDAEAGVTQVMEILSRLPDRSRVILELRFLRGYSIREAAEEMAVSVANAKVLQFRALRHAATISAELSEERSSAMA
jgi:RNA polymerase sigma factor (sigma-70 family)